jgi:hypothetical protein
MITPTESFNNMQAILAECSSAGIVITQQNAAIRFARLLQPLSASYIPLMQFVLSTENMTLGILLPQECMIDSLLSKHSNAMNANAARPSWGTRGNIRTPPDSKFRAPCTWCGIPGHNEERCFSKDPSNLTRFPPRNGWNTPDGKPPLTHIEKHRLPQPRTVPSVTAHQVTTVPQEFQPDIRWLIDSSASQHMGHNIYDFQSLDLTPTTPLPTICFGDGCNCSWECCVPHRIRVNPETH